MGAAKENERCLNVSVCSLGIYRIPLSEEERKFPLSVYTNSQFPLGVYTNSKFPLGVYTNSKFPLGVYTNSKFPLGVYTESKSGK